MADGTGPLRELLAAVSTLPSTADDSERIDRIRLLEEAKAILAAAQARETAEFTRSQRAAQAAAGVPERRVGVGIASQVGLARRVSPFHASRYVGWAMVLTSELPHTYAALRAGKVSEWRAMIVARETIWLSREHRAVVDAELAPKLESLGDRKVEAEAKKIGYRLDPKGYAARIRGAVGDRHVSIRPAPDVMCRLTALLPAPEGVACYASLTKAADTVVAAGDDRGRGQIMADTLVERLTGQASAGDVPVEITLVMTDRTLFTGTPTPTDAPRAHTDQADSDDSEAAPHGTGATARDAGADEPAHLDGYGPIPAELARDLIHRASDHTPMWLRRLYTRPDTGQLAAMDSRRRYFTPAQRHFLRLRDQACRTPWCDAAIRHTDHVVPAEAGGPTSVTNGQGLCEACNYAKQAPDWDAEILEPPGEFAIRTPTGHQYRHRPPDPPGGGGGTRARPRLEPQPATYFAAA